MQFPVMPPRRTLLSALALGTLLGTLVLGVGGRIAMRIFGALEGQAPGFTLGGSLTVVLLGAVAGFAGGAILSLSKVLFPRYRALRGAFFWAALTALTLRGLRPIDALRLMVFLPVVFLFGVALQVMWCQVVQPRLPLLYAPQRRSTGAQGEAAAP